MLQRAYRFHFVNRLRYGLLGLAFCGLLTSGLAAQPDSPNIVLIYTDDVGFNEFGFAGNTEFSTPNLDALAQNSVRFTNAYVSAPVCSPSRAGLMTGTYQQRFGFEFNVGITPPADIGIPADQVTMAERLKQIGYNTGAVGKWHMGEVEGVNRPTDNGFDEYFGFLDGAHDYFTDVDPGNPVLRNNTPDPTWANNGEYLTDTLGREAVDFIDRNAPQAPGDDPFFLYLPFNAMHAPLQAKQDDLDQFPSLTGDQKTRAAMALALDRAIGDVLDKLQDAGIADNTIVAFANDNGGPLDQSADNGELRDGKDSVFEGGIRTHMLLSGPGLTPGTEFDAPVSTLDLFPTLMAAAGSDAPTAEDGVNLLPFLSGSSDAGDPHETLQWRQGDRWAIRRGKWKLLRRDSSVSIDQIELFDLEADPGETTTVAGENPQVVQELIDAFTDWEVGLQKRQWEDMGAEVVTEDEFRFRNAVRFSADWSDENLWRVGPLDDRRDVTLTPADGYANTVLIFGTNGRNSYIATNDLTRSSGLPFMANEMRFDGMFAKDVSRSATIRGKSIMLVDSLSGEGPQLHLEAVSEPGSALYTFNVDTKLILYNDLEITGDGTQLFRLRGDFEETNGSRNILKTGASTATLAGRTSITGDYTIREGMVQLAGGTIRGVQTITVEGGGTLELEDGLIETTTLDLSDGGVFRFLGGRVEVEQVLGTLINNGGVLSPGGSIGSTVVEGDYNQTILGTLEIEIGGRLAGVEHDVLDINGALDAGGQVSVKLVDLGDGKFMPELGDSFQVLEFDEAFGKFNRFNLPDLGPGLGWDTTKLATTGRLEVVFKPVPEPSGLVCSSVLALTTLAHVRRRRLCRKVRARRPVR